MAEINIEDYNYKDESADKQDDEKAAQVEESEKEAAGDNKEDPAEADTDKKSLFKDKKEKKEKKDKKDKKDKTDPKDARIEELNDRLIRLMAEYDNYRKRTDKEKSAMFEMGAKAIVERIIPVIDNFERGFASVPEESKDDPFYQGMDKVYQQFMTALEDAGVSVIEAVGREFDPNMHNAIMHVDDEELGDNVVVEEFQKGYMYKDSVVRYSMVKVAN